MSREDFYHSENSSSSNSILETSNQGGGKEVLKHVKVYIPAENYDSKLSFDQNLAEGRVKLFSEMPVSSCDISDPVKACLTFPLVQKPDFNVATTNDDQSNYYDYGKLSDFDTLANSGDVKEKPPTVDRQSRFNAFSFKDFSKQNIDTSEKLHICDVCFKSFQRRRDLALHYLTHTEKEKRKALKRKICDLCENDERRCVCTSHVDNIYPNFTNVPNSFSLPQPTNTSTLFVKAQSASGNVSLIKRDLFHCPDPDCNQSFGLESQVKQHLLVHKRERVKKEKQLSKETVFSCDICDKTFSESDSLSQHVSTVHLERSESM